MPASAFSCQWPTQDQSHARGSNSPGGQHSGSAAPILGPLLASPPKSGPVMGHEVPHPSASLGVNIPGQLLSVTLGCQVPAGMQEDNQWCTFQWKCPCLICISKDSFFYRLVTACDASITHTASGNMGEAEPLPKIKSVCQSRSI